MPDDPNPSRGISRTIIGVAFVVALTAPGCATMREAAPNPLMVPVGDYETVYNTTVGVLDEYFDIATESRQTGEIVTHPVIAAGIFSPWAGDSVGFRERLECTLQSNRRFAKARVEPVPGGGFTVRVEVFKELEDLTKPLRQAGGRSIFYNEFPINRTREIVGPVPLPAGWIPRGRDPLLEEKILRRIRDALFL